MDVTDSYFDEDNTVWIKMRQKGYKMGEYYFTVELDTGGSEPDGDVIVWIYDEHKEIIVGRGYFLPTVGINTIRKFCRKFCNDEDFRKTVICNG